MEYVILDPAGNITALVSSPADISEQPALANEIMRRHPAVEQVGFLDAAGEKPALRMAGGEFCGNASLCAGALLLLQRGGEEAALSLSVSGAAEPVALRLSKMGEDSVSGSIRMPPVRSAEEVTLPFDGASLTLPLVRMQGISHLVVEDASPLFSLKDRPADAERAVRQFCAALKAEGLGLLFLERAGARCSMTPLVYIPGSGTVFWEHSCASGTAAVGALLAKREKKALALTVFEPGGRLRVRCDPASGEIILSNTVRFLARHRL